jgi:ornithine cyclodeaminase
MTGNRVLLLQHHVIAGAGITPARCVEWVEDSFRMKYDATLPPKISIHPQGDDFFNTMPCLLPKHFERFAMKEVHRIEGQEPALGSDILLYDSISGNLLAILDGDWITTMRTGAVAALSARLFKKPGVNTYSFIGLGNTARAAALCIIDDNRGEQLKFRLMRYKDQAESFIERFKGYDNVTFEVLDDLNDFVAGAEILISCITAAKGLICDNDALYQPGMLLIPVHTRGFQNCDLFFDKVFGDDTGHIKGFKYFSQFREFYELSQVLLGQAKGRKNDQERILCYNIGLGLHDAVFASRICDMLCDRADIPCFIQDKETSKFWI